LVIDVASAGSMKPGGFDAGLAGSHTQYSTNATEAGFKRFSVDSFRRNELRADQFGLGADSAPAQTQDGLSVPPALGPFFFGAASASTAEV
jgi:hypothetical protein